MATQQRFIVAVSDPVYAYNFNGALSLGFKFTPLCPMSCLGTRYYRYSQCTYTVSWTGGIYRDSDKVLLASKQFSGETATGWQYQAFDAPVVLTAGVTYALALHKPDSAGYAGCSVIWPDTYDFNTFPVTTTCPIGYYAGNSSIIFPSVAATSANWYGVDALLQYDAADFPKVTMEEHTRAGAGTGIISINGSAQFQMGLRKEAVIGNPDPPCLALDLPSKYSFRWGVKAGARTISCTAMQVANPPAGYRPSIVVKANPAIGVNADIRVESGSGSGWITIGPVPVTVAATGVLEVQLWNNDVKNFNSTAYFDHITKT